MNIPEIKLVDMFSCYIEDFCFTEEAIKEGKKINKKNNNGYIPKKLVNQKSKYLLTRRDYVRILTKINKKIANIMVYENFSFKIPYRLGELRIEKSKGAVYVDENNNVINHLPVNWGATNRLWKEDVLAKKQKKLIRFTNEHYNGYIVKVTYNKFKANYANKIMYRFRPSKAFRALIAKSIKSDQNVDFYLKKNYAKR